VRQALPLDRAEADPAGSQRVELWPECAGDPAAKARALHGLAVSCLQLGRLAEARRRIEEGLDVARRHGLAAELAELRATAAQLWFHSEQPERALGMLNEAICASPPGAAATLLGQRAHLWFRLGRHEEGLRDSEDALAALARAVASGERLGRSPQTIEARIRSNRGLACFYRGEAAQALGDLERAEVLYRAAGAEALGAQALHNLGFVEGCLGEVPSGLRRLAAAAKEYEQLGLPCHQLLADRAMLLLAAGLIEEARAGLREASRALAAAGLAGDAAEALLSLAEACLADEDLGAADRAAATAEAAFERQRRSGWAVLARELRARVERTRLAERGELRALAASASCSAEALAAAGWEELALQARLEGVAAAVADGQLDEAAHLLQQDGRSSDPVVQLEARAIGLFAAGRFADGSAALRAACRAALSRDRARGAAPSATGVHAGTGGLGPGALATASREGAGAVAGVARLGVALSLFARAPEAVLGWAAATRLAAGATADDLDGVLVEAARRGGVAPAGGVLLHYVVHAGSLLAVLVDHAGTELHELCPSAEVDRAAATLHFALRGLVSGHEPRLGAVAARAIETLDERVGAPLRRCHGVERLQIVPDGVLSELPFGLLPSLAGLRWELVPPAGGDATAPSASAAPERVLVVAGPHLEAAGEEARRVAAVWEHAAEVEVLEGAQATSSALGDRWLGCDLLHLAAHGTLRIDNPALSTFRFADGEVTVHELERLGPPPAGIVLTACDAGRVGSCHRAGPSSGPVLRLLGRWAVASVAPLRDDLMPVVSERLHGRLAAGDEPSEALRALRGTGPATRGAQVRPPSRDRLDGAELAFGCLVPHRRPDRPGWAPGAPGAAPASLGESGE
jgi:tetratricopeptide (TPR) repeat protein